MVIYLIRHGETDWNSKRLLQGVTDIPLNQAGIDAAEITARGLKEVPFDLILTSPLQRAKKTAEIIKGNRDIPLLVEDRLIEIGFGIYEGLCCAKENFTIPDPDFVNFFKDPGNYNPPEGGESIAHLCERMTELLHELANNPEYQDKTILLSTHGAAVKGILSSLTITDLKDFWGAGVHKNCAISILDVENGEISLRQENVVYYEGAKETNYYE